jgi:hypothetical protein
MDVKYKNFGNGEKERRILMMVPDWRYVDLLCVLICPRQTLSVCIEGSFCLWNSVDLHASPER